MKNFDFEEKLILLEEYANKLEDDTINLNDSILIYEKASILSKELLKYLNEAEAKIKKLNVELQEVIQDE